MVNAVQSMSLKNKSVYFCREGFLYAGGHFHVWITLKPRGWRVIFPLLCSHGPFLGREDFLSWDWLLREIDCT